MDLSSEEGEDGLTSIAHRGRTSVQTSPVFDFFTGEPVEDAEAKIKRRANGNGVDIEIETYAAPGDAITVFMGAFNNPDACEFGSFGVQCDFPDVGNPDTQASLMWTGAGGIADEDGEVELESFVEVGNEPGEILLGPGYTNLNAELHFIVRSKGQAGDNFGEQVATYDGGCDVNDCADLQFALFNGL